MPKRTRTTQPDESDPSQSALDFARLPGLSMDALRELWAVHVGRATPPRQKQVLIRELAWRAQPGARNSSRYRCILRHERRVSKRDRRQYSLAHKGRTVQGRLKPNTTTTLSRHAA